MSREHFRIVFMGTPGFAVPALKSIAESKHEVVGVITQPDRGKGRGKDKSAPPIKETARTYDIEAYQPEDIDTEDSLQKLAEWTPDIAVITAYGQILPKRILELPPEGCINIHASLLPELRGAAPINWALIRGKDETGITIMQMDEGLDTGPMLLKESVPITDDDTAQTLHDRLADLGAELILEALDKLQRNQLELTPQDDDQSSYAPMLSKDDGEIDWSQSARDVFNHVRGVYPWPGAFSHHVDSEGEETRIKIHEVSPVPEAVDKGSPGDVLEADSKASKLVVACGDGAVQVDKLQAPGREAMGPGDFLNGFEIQTGDIFQ